MKKILIITNIITLSLFIWCWFFHCHAKQVTKGTAGSSTNGTTTPAAPPCTQAIGTDPYNFQMNTDDAIQLVNNYTNNHWRAISSNATFGTSPQMDSRCVWLSVARLKGFINAIENQAGTIFPNCCNDTMLGIRIYFAEYDTMLINKFRQRYTYFNPNNANYDKKTTILMVPTYLCGNANHDFNPTMWSGDPGNTQCSCAITDSFPPGGTMVALMMDHVGIIPPPYPSKFCPGYMSSGADFMIKDIDPDPTHAYYFTATPNCQD